MTNLLWGDHEPNGIKTIGLHHLKLDWLCCVLFHHYGQLAISTERLTSFITDDPEVIKSRNQVIIDLVKCPQLVRALEQFCQQSLNWHEFMTLRFENEERFLDHVASVDYVTSVIDTLANLQQAFASSEYTAPWLFGMRETLAELWNQLKLDEFSMVMKERLPEVSKVRSYRLGINIDQTLNVQSYKCLGLGTKKMKPKNKLFVKTYLLQNGYYPIAIRPYRKAAAYAVANFKEFDTYNEILPKCMHLMTGRSGKTIPSDVCKLLRAVLKTVSVFTESIVFYLGAIRWIEYLQSHGFPFCFARISDGGNHVLNGLYDTTLTETMKKEPIIPFKAAFQDEIAVITGANSSGKTCFARAVTMAQVLFQLGFPLAAESAQLANAQGIAVVFAIEEQEKTGTGRLGVELADVVEAVHLMKECRCFACLNEPLTGTSIRDSAIILSDVLLTMCCNHAEGVLVTHNNSFVVMAKSLGHDHGSTVRCIYFHRLGEGECFQEE